MATNPLGPGTKNLSVSIPDPLYAALSELAGSRKLGAYVREVLAKAAKSGVIYETRRTTRSAN